MTTDAPEAAIERTIGELGLKDKVDLLSGAESRCRHSMRILRLQSCGA